ncbi:hypothetical protein HDU92_005759 [Lobulomyces angularis]|nr:hypothetical protein HDU92_005759 [Lobulomyces angularis]
MSSHFQQQRATYQNNRHLYHPYHPIYQNNRLGSNNCRGELGLSHFDSRESNSQHLIEKTQHHSTLRTDESRSELVKECEQNLFLLQENMKKSALLLTTLESFKSLIIERVDSHFYEREHQFSKKIGDAVTQLSNRLEKVAMLQNSNDNNTEYTSNSENLKKERKNGLPKFVKGKSKKITEVYQIGGTESEEAEIWHILTDVLKRISLVEEKINKS